ncbi:MAG: ATP-binding protein [Firmicutes bacterium]|nr:ATP-binding protein [Bacillota bacterium]MCM1393656.1 ATP-binding protein [[Eubacterium] siraeum]
MQNIKRKLRYILLLVPVLIILVCTLTSCQSTDKSQSFLNNSGLSYSQFEYDSVNNITKVIWATTLTNDTIYNFDSFSVEFKLYNNSTLIGTKTYNYDKGVKHGGNYTGKFNFYADGEITSIEYVSWSANYNSFWDTYKIWFIITIVVSVILALAYIIVMIIEDLELGDVGEFIADHWWIAFSLLLPIGSSLYGIITSSWVPVLIVIGGVVAVIIIGLIAHLIKFIVEEADFGGFGSFGRNRNIDDGEEEFEEIGDIEDCLDSPEKLDYFNVSDLKEYCRDNGIHGYSSLNKSQLIDLIVNHREDNSEDISNKATNKHTYKTKTSSFDDIAGLENAKKAFKEKVVYAFEHKDLYEKYGKKVGGGLLLYGLPGTGKTLFAEAASNETDALFIPVKCSDIKSKWYGESENNVKKIFDKARKAKRAIIFFDEFEAIGAKRTDNSDNGNNDLVPQILAEMQGIDSTKNDNIIMVIAATNKPWAIDSAFLRPGRFDEKIYIPLPDFEARKKLFELKLKSTPQQDLNYQYLAEISDGFNGADIGEFCDKLKMLAINRSITINDVSPITMEDVSEIKEIVKSSVSTEDIKRLEEFMNK